jgi:hypothetical protein
VAKGNLHMGPAVFSYSQMRRAAGGISAVLPFALWVGNFLLTGETRLLPSMSAYYYTAAQGIFVVSMSGIAFFLLACKGYDRTDQVAGMLGCIFALGVALLPTPGVDPTTRQVEIGAVHFACAGLLFATYAFFCLRQFVKTMGSMTAAKRKRNLVYRVCGWTIIFSISLIAVVDNVAGMASAPVWAGWLLAHHWVYCMESIASEAFAVAWMTKGGMMLRDKPGLRG